MLKGLTTADITHAIRTWFMSLWEKIEPTPASTAVVRRCSKVEEGRVRLYFQAILFGNNPFDLERFGPVYAADGPLPDGLCPTAQAALAPFRFYVLDRVHYPTPQAIAQVWGDRGIPVALTSEESSSMRSSR